MPITSWTPQNVIDAFARTYHPFTTAPVVVDDPCAGDGRIGLTMARALGTACILSDLHPPEHDPLIHPADALQWTRPQTDARVLVITNPPFGLLDPLVERIWGQLEKNDELVFLISSVSLANNSRPSLLKRLEVMPFRTLYDIRWRCPFEMPDGTVMKGAAMCHQFFRSVKGKPTPPGQTTQIDLYR